jgi:hypothetical protein
MSDVLQTFVAAVEQLHAVAATAAARAAANAWLVHFAASPGSAGVCASLLAAPGAAPEPALVFASGLLAEAAARQGASTVEPLLQLCATPSLISRAALARLASAAAAVAVSARAEHTLLSSGIFLSLEPARQLLLVHAVADAAAASGSAEELAARPSLAAARAISTSLLARALLGHGHAAASAPIGIPPCAALRCLEAWAEAGLGLAGLGATQPPLLAPLAAALAVRPWGEEAAAALAVLRAAAEATRDLGAQGWVGGEGRSSGLCVCRGARAQRGGLVWVRRVRRRRRRWRLCLRLLKQKKGRLCAEGRDREAKADREAKGIEKPRAVRKV